MTVCLKDVFEQKIRDLTLNEFPCGNGKWRNNLRWISDVITSKKHGNDASLFTNECLLQLCDHVPYQKQSDWSKDVDSVIKKFIIDPVGNGKNDICGKFKQLRLVSTDISHVGPFLKHFTNLEELTLSVNRIKHFDAKVLPPSMKVLELCGNEISTIDGLVSAITLNLLHLGLGYNFISSISNYTTGWSGLISLDLSFNKLTDLIGTIKALSRISTLRVLCLYGNPLFVAMGYRGVIVDSLPDLSVLDDSKIFTEERYRYQGMSELEGLPLDYASVRVKFRGFNDPEIQDDPVDPQIPEFPKKTHYYQVSFNFVDQFHVFDESEMGSDHAPEDETAREITFNNSSKTITSEEFEFSSTVKKQPNTHKYIICKTTNQLVSLLSRDLELRLLKSTVVSSNEPKPESPTMDVSLNPSKLLAVKKSKHTASSTSVNIKKKKSGMKVADKQKEKEKDKDKDKDKDGKKNKEKKPGDEQLHIWSRDAAERGACVVDCGSVLDSGTCSTADGRCVFLPGGGGRGGGKGGGGKESNNIIPAIAVELPQENSTEVIKEPVLENLAHDITKICEQRISRACLDFEVEVVRWESMGDAASWMKRFHVVQ